MEKGGLFIESAEEWVRAESEKSFVRWKGVRGDGMDVLKVGCGDTLNAGGGRAVRGISGVLRLVEQKRLTKQ